MENPPHVDRDTMLHISDGDLERSLSLSTWRAHRASESAPRPVGDLAGWARRRSGRATPPAVAPILAEADALLTKKINFLDASVGRSSFYGFHYLRWMEPLLEAYALTGEATYAARWGELLSEWYAVREQVVGDWPGLDVIWYSLGVWSRTRQFIQAISLLSGEPAFTDEQWSRTMKSIVGGARWAAEEHDRFRQGNWQLTSVSELVHVASVFPELSEATAWHAVGRARIEDHLELDFYADGGHYERSPGYHTMCVRAMRVAALADERLVSGRTGSAGSRLLDHPRVQAGYAWLSSLADPAGWIPHLQDSGIERPAAELLAGHYLFGEPTWKWQVEQWLGIDQIVDLLDRLGPHPDGADAVETYLSAPSTAPGSDSELLRTSGYAVLRQGWSPRDLTTTVNLGPYVGHELEPHSHHASLDFVISGWGRPLAWEAGSPPTYDDPDYYDWYQSGRGHNSLALGGEPASAERNTVVDSFASLAGLDVVAGRHDAFDTRHRRQLIFIRSQPSYWLITDDLDDDRPSTWTVHGLSPWQQTETTDGGLQFMAVDGPGLLVIAAQDPVSVEYDSGPARVPRAQVRLEHDLDQDVEDRRTSTDDYRSIYGLRLHYETAHLQSVLVPFETEPPVVAVCPPTGSGNGGTISGSVAVTIGDIQDQLGIGSWSRACAGTRVESARWDMDPDLIDSGRSAEWVSGRGITDWWCRQENESLSATVITDRRTRVSCVTRLLGPMTINGVSVAAEPPPVSGRREFTLPAQGTWSIKIDGTSDGH